MSRKLCSLTVLPRRLLLIASPHQRPQILQDSQRQENPVHQPSAKPKCIKKQHDSVNIVLPYSNCTKAYVRKGVIAYIAINELTAGIGRMIDYQ